jgi:hypothetical protein
MLCIRNKKPRGTTMPSPNCSSLSQAFAQTKPDRMILVTNYAAAVLTSLSKAVDVGRDL